MTFSLSATAHHVAKQEKDKRTIDQTIDGVLRDRIIRKSRKLKDERHAAVEGVLAADVGAVVDVCAFGGVDCGGQWLYAVAYEAVESKALEEGVEEIWSCGGCEG